jgi:hypothetical protein
MGLALALFLTDTQLIAQLSQRRVLGPSEALSGGLSEFLRALGKSEVAPFPERSGQPVARLELGGPIDQERLGAQLEQAFSGLQRTCQRSLGGAQLQVQLGLGHARIGLIELTDVSAGTRAGGNLETYAQAWVRQMLHLDPSRYIIRHQVIGNGDRLLVSCIERWLYDVLADFCKQQGLRFASCRPAVLSVVAPNRGLPRQSKAPVPKTIVWTEVATAAARSSRVQLLGFDGAHLVSSWRGWIPAAGEGHPDSALEGAIRRFQAACKIPGDAVVRRIHWPPMAPDGQSAPTTP